jgi:hypothetical protein
MFYCLESGIDILAAALTVYQETAEEEEEEKAWCAFAGSMTRRPILFIVGFPLHESLPSVPSTSRFKRFCNFLPAQANVADALRKRII